MKRFATSVLIASFAITHSGSAAELLPSIGRAENPAQLVKEILCPSGVFEVVEARRFLFKLKREVKEQHDIDLDLNLVKDEAIRILHNTGRFSETGIETARK